MERNKLRRDGWKLAFKSGRVTYWTDPSSGQPVQEHEAVIRNAKRTGASLLPGLRRELSKDGRR